MGRFFVFVPQPIRFANTAARAVLSCLRPIRTAFFKNQSFTFIVR